MKRRTRILLLIATIAVLAAPVIGEAAINLLLLRADACVPAAVKQSNPANTTFASDTCAFTYQGQWLLIDGAAEGTGSKGWSDASTKVTVLLKRGTTVLLSCSKEGGWTGGGGFVPRMPSWTSASCSASKTLSSSIPLGTKLTCTAQVKLLYPAKSSRLAVSGSCTSIGDGLQTDSRGR